MRWTLTAVVLAFLFLFLIAAAGRRSSSSAFSKGASAPTVAAIREADALSALRLTLLTAAVAVPLQSCFRGLCGMGDRPSSTFSGKEPVDHACIDLPFADLSRDLRNGLRADLPGSNGVFGPWFIDHGIRESCSPFLASSSRPSSCRFRLSRRKSFPSWKLLATTRRKAASGARRRAACKDVLQGDTPEHQVGRALRRHPLQCPGDGRVRRRVGAVRAHPGPDEHAAAAGRDSLQRVQLSGGVRGGLAPGAFGTDRPRASRPSPSAAWSTSESSRTMAPTEPSDEYRSSGRQ